MKHKLYVIIILALISLLSIAFLNIESKVLIHYSNSFADTSATQIKTANCKTDSIHIPKLNSNKKEDQTNI